MSIERVINFRPAGGADRGDWAARLEKCVEVVELPLLEVVPAGDPKTALEQADAKSWLIFASANAVRVCLPYLRGRGFPLACVGEKTAAALREEGLEPSFIPSRPDARTLVTELLPLLKKSSAAPSCVYLRGRITSVDLPLAFENQGIRVSEAVVYETIEVAPPEARLEILRSAAGEERTAFLFSNSGTVRLLAAGASRWGVDLEKLRQNRCFAIGPETEKTLREEGFGRVIVAEEPSLEALVDSILPLC